MKELCRWRKHYMPDERYEGKVGWCIVKDKPSTYIDTCEKMAEGKQHWLSGKEVIE